MARSTSQISVVIVVWAKKPTVVTFSKALIFHNLINISTELALNPEHTIIAVIDCFFLRKTGKKTDGKADFYNGVAGKSEQGLEISVISIVEIETRLSYSLSVQQIPSLK